MTDFANVYRRFLLPVGMLSGAIIGAGVFSLPYLLHPLGGLAAIAYLAILGFVFVFVHLLYADLMLRSAGPENFVGIARCYFGRPGTLLTVAIGVLQMFFVLLIYLVLSKSFFALFTPAYTFAGTLLFWLLGSAAIFLSVRKFAFIEFLVTLGIMLIIGVVFALGVRSGGVLFPPAVSPFPVNFALLAIGPALFSLSGRVAVAETVTYFNRSRAAAGDISRAIVWGTMIPACVYALFVFAVWALSPAVTEDSVTGLAATLSSGALALLGILGILSLWSSYICAGANVKDILHNDLRFSKFFSGAFVAIIPVALYAFGFTNFLRLVEFTGSTFLAVEGMLIMSLWQRANRTSAPVLFRRLSWYAFTPIYIVFALALASVL